MLEIYRIEKSKKFEYYFEKTLSYIINVLKNPDAACALVIEVDKAIKQRTKMPKAFKPYTVDLKNNRVLYYIKIGNFIALYYVNDKEKTMTFIAFLYARMGVSNILKLIEE